ncbi:UNVERIFIED_CONTAM: hypothetical protein Sangu_3037300 [Sesamum angustifolium]|uniref:Uncharacterized protein n=1 Tax=Sesamum angustifolium TaxID=2727405 RepID=A0AAW2KEF0_9LAMI
MGVLDPCSGSDNTPCKPLQSSAQARSHLGRGRFSVLHTCCEGILLSRTSCLRPAPRPTGLRRGADLEAHVVPRDPRAPVRARAVGPRRRARSLGCGKHGGYEAPGLCLPRNKRSTLVHAGGGVGEECYLVDPASSHMLVSKIKPCMCKYELIQTVKLRMAH